MGGIRGLGELKRRVDSGEMKAAFALYPVSMKQLIDIADTGNIMPPKTNVVRAETALGSSHPLIRIADLMKNLRKIYQSPALSILSAASLTAAGNGGKRAEWIFPKAKNPKAAIDFVESGRYCSQAGEPSEISFVRAKRSADPAKKLSA